MYGAPTKLLRRMYMKDAAKMDSQRSIKSAERVFDLIEAIGTTNRGATYSNLRERLGLPKSSLHALLEVMVRRGYTEFDAETRTYSLGIRVWEAGSRYQRHHSLLNEARLVLEDIVQRVNETTQLATLAGSENVYLAKVDSTHVLRLQSEVGTRLSAHATGIGKALLSQLTDEQVRQRFGSGDLAIYTRTTYSTVAALLEELDVTRRRGFAVDNEEYTPGVFCLAVPVFQGVGPATIALSVSVPIMRATLAQLALILMAICDGSLQISARCGVARRDPRLVQLSQAGEAARAIDDLSKSERYRLSALQITTATT